jgi:hypothetical protein
MRAVAPTVPSLAYSGAANNGNTAAKLDRIALFAAIAEAAMGLYVVTRYVNVDVNTKYIPPPKGTEAKTGTIQWTAGYVVKASQNRPTRGMRDGLDWFAYRLPRDTQTPPTCPIWSLTSGGRTPPFSFETLR